MSDTLPIDPAPDATPKPAAKANRRPQAKSTRRRSRELALQGLYQWLISGAAGGELAAHLREQAGYAQAA
ncbi:MAG: N utilization substance protein B, partial [Burkholderiales bacterium PBB4]